MMPQAPFARWMRTQKGAVSRYGAIVNNTWENERLWCRVIEVPTFLNVKNTLTNATLTHVYCNRDMVAPLLAAFDNVHDAGMCSQLKTFDGCFEIRPIRGVEPEELSAHSWALAIDFNAAENRLGEEPNMPQTLVRCFTSVGFVWGGTFPRKDGMHFSWLGW